MATVSRSANWIRPIKREAFYRRDGYACVYCGGGDDQTLDHLLPEILGGTNVDHNIVTACVSCNSAKRGLTLAEFVPDVEEQARIRKQAKRRVKRIVAELRFERAVEAEVARRLAAMPGATVDDEVGF